MAVTKGAHVTCTVRILHQIRWRSCTECSSDWHLVRSGDRAYFTALWVSVRQITLTWGVSFLIAHELGFRNEQLTGTVTQAIHERHCGREAEIKKRPAFSRPG